MLAVVGVQLAGTQSVLGLLAIDLGGRKAQVWRYFK